MMNAERLGLNGGEHAALVQTLHHLEAGNFTHVTSLRTKESTCSQPLGFNMAVWAVRKEDGDDCGTCACIGGYASMLYAIATGKKESKGINGENEKLRSLFYPELTPEQAASVTPKEAAQALRATLESGFTVWPNRIERMRIANKPAVLINRVAHELRQISSSTSTPAVDKAKPKLRLVSNNPNPRPTWRGNSGEEIGAQALLAA